MFNMSDEVKQLIAEAEQGSWLAQYALGEYHWKVGDRETALRWFKKSAEQGFAVAQNRVGYCYQKGEGVINEGRAWLGNLEIAMEWYRKAAEQGYAEAQKKLADCYYKEWRIEHDYEKAAMWYRKAAEQGHAQAQYMLGLCYRGGRGVAEDEQTSDYWMNEAEKNGYVVSDSAAKVLNKLMNDIGFEQFSKLL